MAMHLNTHCSNTHCPVRNLVLVIVIVIFSGCLLQGALHQFRCFEQRVHFRSPQIAESLCQELYSARPRLLQQSFAFGRCGHANSTRIFLVSFNLGEARALQARYDATHGWSLNLLGCCELSERHRSAEYEYGERRQSRGASASENVLLGGVAQEMNGRRMQAVRYFQAE